MTNEIDWDNAPEWAEFYNDGKFMKRGYWWDDANHCWVKIYASYRDGRAFGIDYRKRPQPKPPAKRPTTSTEYLSACAQVQSERAKQYDVSGTGERSFEEAAEAFNCVTGKNLRGSDVCLILEMVKLVRQYSDPTRLHEDSVLDKVSYSALWAEEITKELG